MYAMLAGRPPFTAEEPLSIIHQVVNNVPVSLREMKEQCSREVVPIWLSDVVDRILARDPDDRPQSAVELRQCLVSKSITMLRHVDNSNDRTIQRLTARRSPRFGTARQLLSLATLGLLLVGAWFGTSWLLSNQSLPSPDALPTDASAAPEACTIAFADGKTADFASLTDAIDAAKPQSIIQLNTLGPFQLDSPPLDLHLEIRGLSKSDTNASEFTTISLNDVWNVQGHLTLTGITLEAATADSNNDAGNSPLLAVSHGELALNQCRLIHRDPCLELNSGSTCVVEDSLLAALGEATTIRLELKKGVSCTISNSQIVGATAFLLRAADTSAGTELILRESTVYSHYCFRLTNGGPVDFELSRCRLNHEALSSRHRFCTSLNP